MSGPTDLRCEHAGSTWLGLWTPRPRLSWRLPPGSTHQTAYEVRLDDGRSRRIESDEHVLIPWPFEPLQSRERRSWQVRVRTDAGASAWSGPVQLEAGLLDTGDWSARWIEPGEEDRRAPGERPAWLLRHQFELDATTSGARLYATAHGIYEVFLNGFRVGDVELAPGFTSYATNIDVQTYDVDRLLVEGVNSWEVALSDGWFRGRHGTAQRGDGFGETLAFLGQLEVGSSVVATSADWVATTGPIIRADLMGGQAEDRRIEPGPWRPVAVADHGFAHLTGSPSPPVRAIEELRPQSVATLHERRHIVDLGQNINGRLRLRHLGPAGARVTLAHGEALDLQGDLTTEHLEPNGLPIGQIDEVTWSDRDDGPFEPRHTIHGFQFARVDGPLVLAPEDVTGVVVHTDLRRTGWFRCSDDRLNRFHDIATWSFRGNACDIPTDCPHRERSGWTGDWQLFVPSASFLYDVAGFSAKWLRDLAAEQMPDGLLPNYAPDPRRRRALADGDLTWFGMLGSAGWGDACVIVPWELYQRYGDHKILEDLWPTMCGWLDYAAASARTKHHATRSGREAHEQFLWDGGWHWGEWCEPATDGEPFWSADQGHVATAYLHHTAALAARIGRVLGHDDDVARFEALADGARHAWQVEYLDDDSAITPDTQANHVRALAFGLIPDDHRERVADRLVELIHQAGDHLGTGFLATPLLLPILTDTGHLDVAYQVLLNDTPPSWLAMVDRGATTVWEEWEGIDAAGAAHASLNHYSKGAVVSFLHRYVAGIMPIDDELAYRRFRIAPRPGASLTWAEASFESPRGRIESSWRISDGTFTLTATVPPGSAAEVVLPDGTTVVEGPGTTQHSCVS